jgi:large subunit ribosomal protein L10
MKKEAKSALKTELAQKFAGANAALLAEYRGLTVAELTELRRALRAAKAEFKIVQNRIARKAIEQDVQPWAPITSKLKGPTGLVCFHGDAAAGVKVALEFQKGHPLFVVKGALLENKSLSMDEIKAVADLPSREVLLARAIGSIVAPHRNLLAVLNGVARNTVQVINAIKEKKEKGQ